MLDDPPREPDFSRRFIGGQVGEFADRILNPVLFDE